MGSEEAKDPLKGVDCKAIGSKLQKDHSASNKPFIKKRLPQKIRQIPDCYSLPRMPTPSTIAFYGACVAGGIGSGMLLEVWINNKIKEGYDSLENKLQKIVDVRDIAQALLLVYEKPEAEGT
ncbi:hypothetical protein GOBAR_AA38563 [Gossypium barbadense]|uniref:Uncharacterized protein n=1 Tax=Gossypium barbadense TaxID=3634 RepID=A0A2P5VTI8_GOSBA|nr:hypothetical protein GOBAR_AA38563 [Gossypium barbadense]